MQLNFRRAITFLCSATLAISSAIPLSAFADWEHIGFMGDLNNDKELNMADLVIMKRHLLGIEPINDSNSYHVNNSFIGIHGADGFQAGEYFVTADINQDGAIDVFDYIHLRKDIVNNSALWVWQWQNESTVSDDPLEGNGDFIGASVNDVYKFMPSQGNGRMLIIYADFADCKFSYLPTTDEIEEIAFGEEKQESPLYPWESVSAFFKRSSKGALELSGKAYHYSTGNSVNNYQQVKGQKALLTEACKALDSEINFKDFDGDNDGYIDTLVLIVPGQASNDTWWPASVQFGNDKYIYDGMKIGHMITGNCQINSSSDYRDFVSTLTHETGHCMGLPDYYRYDKSKDADGLHGTAGSELMDDTGGDLSCVSKLHLGWYKTNQVQVYDPSSVTQTFTLHNAQTSKGNTIIIPYGELDNRYHSEYMMIEYTTKQANNSSPPWYVSMGEGIRIYHVDASLYNNGWWTSFRYASGSEFTDNYEGRRFIRLIDDTRSDNIYKTGSVINENIEGFHWYDNNGRQTIDTGLTIEIGEKKNDSYTITIKNNNIR
ncbi:dockerin type I domain-containing protein [Ruminococcus sp.]|uniref:dockerin type I domain-containing protein n=1 Tax=Ruminococcus sp. TaxID=41978 RepID=UPI0025FBE834|nr:dockerin type I domain-containing protein [Ruminococcus sp.]